jgi:hypothetical protein
VTPGPADLSYPENAPFPPQEPTAP